METTPEVVGKNVRTAIEKLGFIPDAYLIHNPFIPEPGKVGKFWQILESLVEDGTLKGCSLGVSNFREVDLEEVLSICKIRPTMNRQSMWPSHLLVLISPFRDRDAPLRYVPPRSCLQDPRQT